LDKSRIKLSAPIYAGYGGYAAIAQAAMLSALMIGCQASLIHRAATGCCCCCCCMWVLWGYQMRCEMRSTWRLADW